MQLGYTDSTCMNGKEEGKERRPMEHMCVEHEHNIRNYTLIYF